MFSIQHVDHVLSKGKRRGKNIQIIHLFQSQQMMKLYYTLVWSTKLKFKLWDQFLLIISQAQWCCNPLNYNLCCHLCHNVIFTFIILIWVKLCCIPNFSFLGCLEGVYIKVRARWGLAVPCSGQARLLDQNCLHWYRVIRTRTILKSAWSRKILI